MTAGDGAEVTTGCRCWSGPLAGSTGTGGAASTPPGLAQARWLEHYADRFATVESNNAFYRLPEATTFAAWAERTPPDFVMAVKASRYLTHIRRLRPRGARRPPHGPRPPPRRQARPGAAPAAPDPAGRPGRSTGPCGRSRPGPGSRSSPATTAGGPTRSATCWPATGPPSAWPTARSATRPSGAPPTGPTCACTRAPPTPPLLRPPGPGRMGGRLAELVGPGADAYVYFNNDPGGCAVRDAVWFAEEATRAGLHPTRVRHRRGPGRLAAAELGAGVPARPGTRRPRRRCRRGRRSPRRGSGRPARTRRPRPGPRGRRGRGRRSAGPG